MTKPRTRSEQQTRPRVCSGCDHSWIGLLSLARNASTAMTFWKYFYDKRGGWFCCIAYLLNIAVCKGTSTILKRKLRTKYCTIPMAIYVCKTFRRTPKPKLWRRVVFTFHIQKRQIPYVIKTVPRWYCSYCTSTKVINPIPDYCTPSPCSLLGT